MPEKAEFPLEKVTLNLFKGDKEFLQTFFHAQGWSVAARKLLHNVCQRLREIDSQDVVGAVEALDIEISLEDVKTVSDGD